MATYYTKKLAREKKRQARVVGKFGVTIEDIIAGSNGIDEAKARATLAAATDNEVDIFRARYSSYMSEYSWKYPNPMFEKVLVDMLKRDGKMTEDMEMAYHAIIKAHRRRAGNDSPFDALRLPGHYVILRVLGCVR